MTKKEKDSEVNAESEVVQAPADTEEGAAAEAGAAPDHQELVGLLEDERAKADDNWNKLLHMQAELENIKKRNARDLANAHKFALEKIALELLPVRDSMELGIQAAGGEQIDPGKLMEGAELTLKMLTSTLEKFDIIALDPAGERFNPELHQAMSMQEMTDAPNNTVVTVVQKGYTLNGRLIRPALVIVSTGGPKAVENGGSAQEIDEKA
ncbi:MAG TPA: nucleotide exchange factor GrpE [Gammaproteobacteria bacterium]|nr:nucleotide exchange factor GrpE [Gammaproteobacteria bacterium]